MVTKSLKNLILDSLFPKKCVACGKWEDFVCNTCKENIIFKFTQECPTCNTITAKGKYCPRCRKNRNLTGVVAATYYKDPIVKELLHQYKYEGIFSMCAFLAAILAETLVREEVKAHIITFVPLSRKRRASRGYNQSELIAKELGKILKIPVWPLLSKSKETKPQVGLPKKERTKNLYGAFKLSAKESLEGKKVLLVDDVFTTGSTLHECAKNLKEGGAKEVWGAVLAKE